MGARLAKIRHVAARSAIELGGQTVAEVVPVWRDSDTERGVLGRAFVSEHVENDLAMQLGVFLVYSGSLIGG